MSEPSAHVFPPPFDGKKPGGGTVRITDVDELLDLAADHAGVPKALLDRRTLESSLHMIGAPPLHAERATMVLAGRARQVRRATMRRGVRRTKTLAILAVLAILVALYGVRLRARLVAKRVRVEHAGLALGEARRALATIQEHADDREPAGPQAESADAAHEASVLLDAADDRVAVARRHYDDAANDYDASVRGFPTAPFARLVGLPERLPMSWEPGAPGETGR